MTENAVLSKMKTIPRDSESVVRALCEALVRIEELENKVKFLDRQLDNLRWEFKNRCGA